MRIVDEDDPMRLAMERALPALIAERGDERFAHASDVFGCDRATNMRRKGYAKTPLDPADGLRMQLGNDVAKDILPGLLAYYAEKKFYTFVEQRIAWDVAAGRGAYACVTKNYKPRPGEMVGHIDLYAQKAYSHVHEIKSTRVWSKYMPDVDAIEKDKRHYLEQTVTYAIATDAELARLWLFDVNKVRWEVYEWDRADLDALEMNTVFRAQLALEAGQQEDLPDAVPRYPWQCGYCPYAQCVKNPNHKQDVEAALAASIEEASHT
jgi:hypothetical protein